jgi:hypothetical protein
MTTLTVVSQGANQVAKTLNDLAESYALIEIVTLRGDRLRGYVADAVVTRDSLRGETAALVHLDIEGVHGDITGTEVLNLNRAQKIYRLTPEA